MLKTNIKKKLLETKEQKDRLIIEQEIVRSRIMMIFESEDNLKNWDNLSEKKRFKISCKFLQEVSFQQQSGVIFERQIGHVFCCVKLFQNTISKISTF